MESVCCAGKCSWIKGCGIVLVFLIGMQLAVFNITFENYRFLWRYRKNSLLVSNDRMTDFITTGSSFIRNEKIRTQISHVSLNNSTEQNITINPATTNNISLAFDPIKNSCPNEPKNLVGALATYKTSPPYKTLEEEYKWLQPGGRFTPTECSTDNRVAIIIPYRNRETQLKTFLYNIHPFLRRQLLDYGIYVVEQLGDSIFNRAMLMNIGYAEAIKIYNFTCFVFHDVDLIPENDRNLYSCGSQPRHLSVAIDKFKYRLPYASLFGGATQMSRKIFEEVNGFSNLYFGWGGEDDDMWNRVTNHKYKVQRYSMNIARYKMIAHTHESSNKENPQRFKLLRNSVKRHHSDGINSLKYKLKEIDKRKLFTLIKVEINQNEVTKQFQKR